MLPEYTVYRGKRKNIRLVLRTNGTFAVYCPKRTSIYEIEEFLKQHADTLRQKHNAKPDPLFKVINGFDTLPYMGVRRQIEYSDTVCALTYIDGVFIAPKECDKSVLRKKYLDFLRAAAKEYLPDITKSYANRHSFKYSSLRIKAIGSRVGSCSSKGNINLSLALMACDPEFISYVVLHELCHTVHMNHSSAFYALLDRVCPNHRAISERGKREYSALTRAVIYRPCL